jgi:hypothetical protein
MLIAGFFMTQQIINVGTGPDSYTGDTLRTAFEKTNSNFDELYALSSANTSANLSVGNVTATGDITASRFIGDGSNLTGITSSNLGNLIIDGPNDQTILGTVANASLNLKPHPGDRVSFTLQNDSSGIDQFLSFQSRLPNVISIFSSNSSVTIGANAAFIGIDANTNHMSFNTFNTGYDFNFNGELAARSFYARQDFPVGYSFTTPLALTGMSHVYQNDTHGNISLVKISHDNAIPAKFYENNTTLIAGNLVVIQDGNTAGSFPYAFIQGYSSANTYTQFVWQNLDSNSAATGDIVVTADTGTDIANYLDIGIAGSGYDNTNPSNSLGTSINPLDAYIYVQNDLTMSSAPGGSLTIGTTATDTEVRVLVGGVNAENIVATFTERDTVIRANANGAAYGWTFNANGVLDFPYNSMTNQGGTLTNVHGIYATTTSSTPVVSGFKFIFADTSEQTTAWTGNYTAANASNWSGTPPSTISDAIDRLAAVVTALNGGTGA